jgi:hypothetical protein
VPMWPDQDLYCRLRRPPAASENDRPSSI